MVWIKANNRWSGLVNTEFSYDSDNNILVSSNKTWDGIFDFANHKIIFKNKDINLLVTSECTILE